MYQYIINILRIINTIIQGKSNVTTKVITSNLLAVGVGDA